MANMLSDLREPVNGLYYGDGGTGKTTALAAMANLGRIVAVNAESGLKRRALVRHGINVGNIEVFPGPGERVTFSTVEALWRRLDVELARDPDCYVGVIWDSVTEIYKALLDGVVAKNILQAARAGRDRDPFFVERGDYGIMTEQVRSLIRKFRDLPCNFGISALSRREQDDDGSVIYQPAITPALQNDMIGWMDFVSVTSVAIVNGEEEYRGLFRPHGKYRGKDRLGATPKWLVDPWFDRVLSYVDDELTIDRDPIMLAAKERQELAKQAEIALAASSGK